MEEIIEKLQDALSIINLLENDMEAQKAEMVHIRAMNYEVYDGVANTKCTL